MVHFFFFEIYIKFPTPSIPLGGRYDIFHNRKEKIPYGAFKIIFSPETFFMSLGHTGDNLERRFRCHLGGRGLSAKPIFDKKKKRKKKIRKFYSYSTLIFMLERKILSSLFSQLIELFHRTMK